MSLSTQFCLELVLQSIRYEEHLRDGEVDNSGVLLHKEVVLGESFDAKNEVRRQFGQLEPFEEILLVGFVFLGNKGTVFTV